MDPVNCVVDAGLVLLPDEDEDIGVTVDTSVVEPNDTVLPDVVNCPVVDDPGDEGLVLEE